MVLVVLAAWLVFVTLGGVCIGVFSPSTFCPHCTEAIGRRTKVCPHCARDVRPTAGRHR